MKVKKTEAFWFDLDLNWLRNTLGKRFFMFIYNFTDSDEGLNDLC